MSLFERLPAGTFSGHTDEVGDVAHANCAVIQELTSDGSLRPNQEILDYAADKLTLSRLPIAASHSLVPGLQERDLAGQIVLTFLGPSADNMGENTGTYGEVLQYKQFAVANPQYNRPLFISSAYNIGNILRQARLLKVPDIAAPDDLPRTHFDWRSDQLWTKNWALWALTAKLRIEILKHNRH